MHDTTLLLLHLDIHALEKNREIARGIKWWRVSMRNNKRDVLNLSRRLSLLAAASYAGLSSNGGGTELTNRSSACAI